ncbi:Hint domain-containing protein [Gemmatimonas sp.]|uniref:Hint domain-containing protein n=1 Tax=Gemmatimonas sp. TaxID=1962908 RepID=UPI003340DD0C
MPESDREREREQVRREFRLGEEKYREAMQRMKEARSRREDPREAPAHGCFPARTMVHTPAGRRDIADLSKGDAVLALSSDGAISVRSILSVSKHNRSRIDAIRLSSGTVLRTTAAHSFCRRGCWIRAADLNCSDEILGVDGRGSVCPVRVSSIEHGVAVEPVFNLIVDQDFTFLVEGVIAHSFSYWRRSRMVWWRLRVAMGAVAAAPDSRLTIACS